MIKTNTLGGNQSLQQLDWLILSSNIYFRTQRYKRRFYFSKVITCFDSFLNDLSTFASFEVSTISGANRFVPTALVSHFEGSYVISNHSLCGYCYFIADSSSYLSHYSFLTGHVAQFFHLLLSTHHKYQSHRSWDILFCFQYGQDWLRLYFGQ